MSWVSKRNPHQSPVTSRPSLHIIQLLFRSLREELEPPIFLCTPILLRDGADRRSDPGSVRFR